MNNSRNLSVFRGKHFVIGIWLLLLLGFSHLSLASMIWLARAIDPSSVSAIKNDHKLLEQTLFGDQPRALIEQLEKQGRLDLSNKQILDELSAWAAKRKAEAGDSELNLDKAWHGIHFLLTGDAKPNGTLASKVIMGGEDIGPDQGYGPAQLLKPAEVKAIALLLEETTTNLLRKRFNPKAMARANIYPDVIWEREGEEALDYVLDYYKKLVAFYKLAASKGQAVIFVIS